MLFPYHGSKPERLTGPMIVEYASEQISKFTEMLRFIWIHEPDMRKNCRRDECEAYLKLWVNVLIKGGDWNQLSPEERNEVVDHFFNNDVQADDVFESN